MKKLSEIAIGFTLCAVFFHGSVSRAAILPSAVSVDSFGVGAYVARPMTRMSASPLQTSGLLGGQFLLNVSLGIFSPLNINTKIQAADVAGTPEDPIDFENALGVKPENIIIFPEVNVSLFKRFGARVRYETTLADGEKYLKDHIVFDGQDFALSGTENVSSELEETQFKLFLEYHLINAEFAGSALRVTVGGGANLAQTRQMIKSNDSGNKAEIGDSINLPIIAAEVNARFLVLDLTGRIEGMEYEGKRNWDATGGINFLVPPRGTPIPLRAGFFVGYRYYLMDVDGGDVKRSKIEKHGAVAKLQLEIEL